MDADYVFYSETLKNAILEIFETRLKLKMNLALDSIQALSLTSCPELIRFLQHRYH